MIDEKFINQFQLTDKRTTNIVNNNQSFNNYWLTTTKNNESFVAYIKQSLCIRCTKAKEQWIHDKNCESIDEKTTQKISIRFYSEVFIMSFNVETLMRFWFQTKISENHYYNRFYTQFITRFYFTIGFQWKNRSFLFEIFFYSLDFS